MAEFTKTELMLDHVWDAKRTRHYLNDQLSVLHCHHYVTLYTQLADDIDLIDGKKLLREVSEDIFFETLTDYFTDNNIEEIRDKICLAEEYYSAIGLGKMEVVFAGSDSGKVKLTHSHVDEGWIAKWGTKEEPVNFITCGFISALFSVLFDVPVRMYQTVENAGLVSGAAESTFTVVRS